MKTLAIAGKDYQLRIDRKLLGELVTWARPKLPDPLLAIKDSIASFPPHLQKDMIAEAMREGRRVRNITDPEILAILDSEEGTAFVLKSIFGKHHPDLTDEQLLDLHVQAVKEHGSNYLLNAFSEALGL